MRFLSICLPEEEQRSPMLCFSLGDQIHAKEFWWKKELKKNNIYPYLDAEEYQKARPPCC